MAGDLVNNPKTFHTYVHDLESFFWVLIWIVLTRVKTQFNRVTRSLFINGTMNPSVCKGSGGFHKAMFLTSQMMLDEEMEKFSLPGNTPLSSLLVGLKRTVAKRYLPSKDFGTKPETDVDVTVAAIISKMSEGYREVAKAFLMSLSSEKWPKNDKAKVYTILQAECPIRHSRPSTKRSLSVMEIVMEIGGRPSKRRRA